jgi:hypothetical protein
LAAIDYSPASAGGALGSGGAAEKAKHGITNAAARSVEIVERLKYNLHTMVKDLQEI